MQFSEVRKKYPQYGDLTDRELATALHQKHYLDVPFEEFANKVGYDTGNLGDGVRSVAQGLTFGYADEMEAGARSLWEDRSYEDIRDDIRVDNAEFAADNPWLDTGLQLIGGIPHMFIPGVGWTKAASLGKNAAKLAGEGAGYGALAGSGYSEGETLGEVMTDTAVGAGIGGVAAPVIGTGISKVGDALVPDAQTLATNQAFDINTSLAERYPNTLGKVSNFLDLSSGGAVAAKQKAGQETTEAVRALDNLAGSPDTKSAQQVGKTYKESLDKWLATNDETFDTAYKTLRTAVNTDGKSTPTSTIQFLRNERGAYDGADAVGDIVEIPAIKRLRKALTPKEGETQPMLSFDALLKLRSDIGESIKSGKFGTDDVPQAKLKQLYSTLSNDLENSIRANTFERYVPEDVADDFIRLNQNYKDYLTTQGSLRNFFAKANKEEYSPEKIVSTLVKLYRDEPSQLAVLRELHNQAGIDLTEAGKGVLYQTALNRGEVDPSKALERYDIAKSRIGGSTEEYPNPYTIAGVRSGNSPARDLLGNSSASYQYESAIERARRAQRATERGEATDAAQLAMTAIPALLSIANPATIPLSVIGGWIGTYGLRRVLNSGRVGEFVGQAINKIRSKPVGNLTPAESRFMVEVYLSEQNKEQ
ncbi:hypothetical protein [Vibrio breoganii]|uniref:hypothetical protein n=1 Tax=Vibrio breoganii TaxID=553239 RepID=UPI000C8552DD|nr:hypothetical protein [Vibrio breoganii]PMM20305.1 hypothetical protein BCT59_07705 [Vibrio breoganii]